jgi:hypothetical protein
VERSPGKIMIFRMEKYKKVSATNILNIPNVRHFLAKARKCWQKPNAGVDEK